MSPSPQQSKWTCELSSFWDYLGPFPVHAREQHLLSPSYPLNLSEPVNFYASWPSSYADDGIVGWQRTSVTPEGKLEISFPQVRWKNLRATEGWAALQHHIILRTTLTLIPPKSFGSSSTIHVDPRILVDLKQGSYFTLKPKNCPANFVPRWFAGNIYDLERALPVCVDLSGPVSTPDRLEYDLFVSGDYEIRLFGDPLSLSSEVPVLSISLTVDGQDQSASLIELESQHVIADFVDGFAFGNVVGLAVQNVSASQWSIQDVSIDNDLFCHVHAKLRGASCAIAPLQTRIVPVALVQKAPSKETELTFKVKAVDEDGRTETMSIVLPITHYNSESIPKGTAFKGTFLFASSSPSAFLAIPPISQKDKPLPPILALHGAGVDIIGEDFWAKSMPTNHRSWIICATGRTSWGLDWHGPSTIDAFSAVVELSSIVRQRPDSPVSWQFPHDTKVVVIGHSNGGQGTWHVAARYPDKVIAAVPAAGYLKSQAYIPLTMGRGAHFVDPILRAILETSFTPDDNDLHLSNLVDTPILAIHGGADENVPVWHTREAVSTLKSWKASANVVFKEDPGQSHWYPDVLKNSAVQRFLDEVLEASDANTESESFTLTVANPRECGSLHGWKIDHLTIPGRLGRLSVSKVNETTYSLTAVNVHTFSISTKERALNLIVNGERLVVDDGDGSHGCMRISKAVDGWHMTSSKSMIQSPPGRLQAILTSPGPIFIVVADNSLEQNLSVAQRLAHVLLLHHRLDCEIVDERTAIERTTHATWAAGNIVFVGPPASIFASNVLSKNRTPVRLVDGTFSVGGQPFSKKQQAILFTHPHPSGVAPESFLLFVLYNSEAGLERALRLFPFRTGVPGPDWIVTGQKMDDFAAGGIEAAGLWGRDWAFNEPMSWLSQ